MRSPIAWIHDQFPTLVAPPCLKILHMPRSGTLQPYVHQIPSDKIHRQAAIRALQTASHTQNCSSIQPIPNDVVCGPGLTKEPLE